MFIYTYLVSRYRQCTCVPKTWGTSDVSGGINHAGIPVLCSPWRGRHVTVRSFKVRAKDKEYWSENINVLD
jgi:hypothetical protein